MNMLKQAKIKKRRAPTALTLECDVCSAPAPDHFHFGGHCCYSCRAFFRRTIERMEKIDVVCRSGNNACEVSEKSKSCSACRYDKCLSIGMKKELLQGKRKHTEMKSDVARNCKLEKREPKVPKKQRESNHFALEPGEERSRSNENFPHMREYSDLKPVATKSLPLMKEKTSTNPSKADFVKTSVIQHISSIKDLSLTSLVPSSNPPIKTEIDEMYDNYVGEVPPVTNPVVPNNEVSVIQTVSDIVRGCLAPSKTTDLKVTDSVSMRMMVSKSQPPIELAKLGPGFHPRIQNQIYQEAQNLLATNSFDKIFDDIYNCGFPQTEIVGVNHHYYSK